MHVYVYFTACMRNLSQTLDREEGRPQKHWTWPMYEIIYTCKYTILSHIKALWSYIYIYIYCSSVILCIMHQWKLLVSGPLAAPNNHHQLCIKLDIACNQTSIQCMCHCLDFLLVLIVSYSFFSLVRVPEFSHVSSFILLLYSCAWLYSSVSCTLPSPLGFEIIKWPWMTTLSAI